MKSFFLILMLATPAAAQSFYPNLTGIRYCELRRLGVEKHQAARAAIAANLAPNRQSPLVKVNGELFTLDEVDFATRWLVACK